MIGWKKNLQKLLTLSEKVRLLGEQNLINKGGKNLENLPKISLVTLSLMLAINRTSVYYEKIPPSKFEVIAKHRIDELHTAHSSWGQRQLSDQLKFEGIHIGRRRTRRFMEEMAIRTTYPKPNLSQPAKNHKVFPYLLKYFVATKPNQCGRLT